MTKEQEADWNYQFIGGNKGIHIDSIITQNLQSTIDWLWESSRVNAEAKIFDLTLKLKEND